MLNDIAVCRETSVGWLLSEAKKRGLPFGTVRVQVEVMITAGSALLSVVLLHDLSVVGIGTVIAAFCTGMINNCLARLLASIRRMSGPKHRFA